jgi:microcystin-dependent protein
MTSPFVAEIRMFAGNFAPKGWAQCNGQLLPISQNTALFSLLGTNYGGDGKSTFGLPDMQGSMPMHWGDGPGLSQRFIGEQSGTQTVTLLQSEIPSHNHFIQAVGTPGQLNAPAPDRDLARSGGGFAYKQTPFANIQQMNFQTLSVTGSSFPHNNMSPYLTVLFIIAMQGIFPPRS